MLLFIAPFFIKSSIIAHNCNFTYGKFDNLVNESIDYIISCQHQKIIKINLSKINQMNSLSIYGNTNVIIECDNKVLNNFTVKIYNTPTITFENSCYFFNVEIYGSPKIHLHEHSHFSVDTVHLYNQTYDFPFYYDDIIYEKSVNNINLKENNVEQIESSVYECNDDLLEGILNDNYVTIKCGNSFEYTLLYSFFHNHTFQLHHQNIILKNHSSKRNTSQSIATVLSSLHFNGKKNIKLQKFDINEFLNNFDMNNNSDDIWIPITNSTKSFYEKQNEYDQDYLFETGLRKVCEENKCYYYCCDTIKGPRNIIYISKAGTIVIIVVIFISVTALLIALLTITCIRFKKFRQVNPIK